MGEIIPRPIPPVAMAFTGERLTSGYGGQTEIEHLHRYLLARQWCRGKTVLDVASGEGYGAALLAQVAHSVRGVEIDPDAVAHATRSYPATNLTYVVGDARALPCQDSAFDVVVSFETIEHFADQDGFLGEVRRVLRPDGIFVVSTPDRDNYSPAETPANPYHVCEMTPPEFERLLRSRFSNVSFLLQRPVFGSVLLPPGPIAAQPICFERRGDHHFEGSQGLARPQYVVAFATDLNPDALPPSVYIDTGRLGMLSPAVSASKLEAARAALDEERKRCADIEAAAALRLDAELRDVRIRAADLEASLNGRSAEVDARAAELAECQAEVRGLTAANEMAERACAALRIELAVAGRKSAEAEAAARRRAEAEHAARLRAEADAARLVAEGSRRAAEAEALAGFLRESTSWRLTAPLRGFSRLLLRRP